MTEAAPVMVNGFDPARGADLAPATSNLIARREAALGSMRSR